VRTSLPEGHYFPGHVLLTYGGLDVSKEESRRVTKCGMSLYLKFVDSFTKRRRRSWAYPVATNHEKLMTIDQVHA
jgi:hypothetical protein